MKLPGVNTEKSSIVKVRFTLGKNPLKKNTCISFPCLFFLHEDTEATEATEAGGRTTDFNGVQNPEDLLSGREVLATAPDLFEAVCAVTSRAFG